MYETDIVNNDIIDYETNDINDNKFVATNEWQEIKDGQKVPSMLHYRMNLATGKKEAKLLDAQNFTSIFMALVVELLKRLHFSKIGS